MRKSFGEKLEMSGPGESTGGGHDLIAGGGGTNIIARGNTFPTREELNDHYMDIIRKYENKFLQSAAGEIHRHVSSNFLIRLKKIDRQADGNIFLKMITYQEWVDMLLQLNESMVKNLKHLEMDVNERMLIIQKHIEGVQSGQLVNQYQNDIRNLVQLLKNGYYNNEWNLNDVQLTTLDLGDILDPEKRAKSPQSQIVTTLEIPVHSYETCDSSSPEAGDKVEAGDYVPDNRKVREEMDLNVSDTGTDATQKLLNEIHDDSSYSEKLFFKGPRKSSSPSNDCRTSRFSRGSKSEPFATPSIFNIQEFSIKYQLGDAAFLDQDKYDTNSKCAAPAPPPLSQPQPAPGADAEILSDRTRVNTNRMMSTDSESRRMSFENLSYTELGSLKELKVGDSLCALTAEVASKHDEVRMLNRQIMSLEDEIQKSFQKIQLKDDVIKELRMELKSLNLEHKQKREAYSKLDYLRQQLAGITEASDREHLDFNESVNKQLTPDTDDVALCAIRKQILNFRRRIDDNERTIYEIRLMSAEMEARLEFVEERNQIAEQCLKEVAVLMASFPETPIDYQAIYKKELKDNPLCTAFLQFKGQAERKKAELIDVIENKEAHIIELEGKLAAIQETVVKERNVTHFRNKEERRSWTRHTVPILRNCLSVFAREIWELYSN